MITGKPGERAKLWELRGFACSEIVDAFRSVHVMAEATKAATPFFHVQVRNPEGESLSHRQWEITADRIERMLGLVDQPRAISCHIDMRTGHEHMHIAWSRIDEDTLTARPLPFYKQRLKTISRELEIQLGLTVVPNERYSPIRYAPKRDEEEQARRLGVNIHDIRENIRNCLDRSDCGRSFEASLAQEGLLLAQGDRRDFVVIDQRGGLHPLGKRITNLSAARLRDRLGDLTRENLPTVEQAQSFVREPGRSARRPKATPLDIPGKKTIANAPIEKKQTGRQDIEREVRRREKKKRNDLTVSAASELGCTTAYIRAAPLNLVGGVLNSRLAPEPMTPTAKAERAVDEMMNAVNSHSKLPVAPVPTPEHRDTIQESEDLPEHLSETTQQRQREEQERWSRPSGFDAAVETGASRTTDLIGRQPEEADKNTETSGLANLLRREFRAVMKILTRGPEPRSRRRRRAEETGRSFRLVARSLLSPLAHIPAIVTIAGFVHDTLTWLHLWEWNENAERDESCDQSRARDQHHLSPHL